MLICKNTNTEYTWFIWISSVGTFSYPPDIRLSYNKKASEKQLGHSQDLIATKSP